ncbi:Hypothetical predicted protein [Cloeon dipterum]|uniref:Uncharacterized protein n=1 Tax=Cloeon dipterum TaxID=197152 RepID=A0A8S1C2Q6_9INSE|nr:Hypothetical predicted protein [Cloeon dipterum]
MCVKKALFIRKQSQQIGRSNVIMRGGRNYPLPTGRAQEGIGCGKRGGARRRRRKDHIKARNKDGRRRSQVHAYTK